jgi:hypothetical protein
MYLLPLTGGEKIGKFNVTVRFGQLLYCHASKLLSYRIFINDR